MGKLVYVARIFRVRDESGLTTTGMVISLLLVLSLIFSAGQVYRINTLSSRVQNVADAAAIAAENEVAHFMTTVKVCDAITLSLSLTSLVMTGAGVVAMCVPPAIPLGEKLLEMGRSVARARNSFTEKASKGLNRYQSLLPAFAAIKAYRVATANNEGSSRYIALALLSPLQGEKIAIDEAECVDEVQENAENESEEIKEEATKAEEAAKKASAAKARGFARDCGDNPSYCMYERASVLAGMGGTTNPLYQSEDTWSFSVALKRAQAYYAERLKAEAPLSSSVKDQAQSALRMRFYSYANKELQKGFVVESGEVFEANFPLLPRNTTEMKSTTLYTEEQFPCTQDGGGNVVAHAWEGCPGIQAETYFASLAQIDQGLSKQCDICQFSAVEMGKVGAASTSIDNGFEFHYVAVAEAARDYQKQREILDPLSNKVKGKVSTLFESIKDALGEVAGQRIKAQPPGHNGVVVLVADCGQEVPSGMWNTSFVASSQALGTRVALSSATLVADPADEEGDVISSLLDSFKQDGSAIVGFGDFVLDGWSWLLQVYTKGQEALLKGVEELLNGIPLMSASGLGAWAQKALKEGIETIGLEPANLDALKPVLVNSAHVAQADGGSVGARLVGIKQQVVAHPLNSNELFSSLIGNAEAEIVGWLGSEDSKITIAEVELLGEGGPSLPLEIVLPPFVRETSISFVQDAAGVLQGLVANVVGVRTWD